MNQATLQLQQQLNALGANLKLDGKMGPLTLAAAHKYMSTGLQNNPITSQYLTQNSPESLTNAITTGDYSGLKNASGQPFSLADQKEAETKATSDLSGAYNAQKQYDTANTQDTLAQKQQDYNDYLAKSQQDFQTQKTSLDQTAANQGVLFSGGRMQKQNDLKNTFDQAQASKLATAGRDIAGTARNYEYNYGTGAANNLSSMYNLGSNSYNPNIATGGATSNGLSRIYNTGQGDYQGTAVNAQKAAVQQRAAGLLWNKGNKIVGGTSIYNK